jgi:uncharacterized protein
VNGGRPAEASSGDAVRQIVLKVHSRCNLACTYCYVYESVDQSWRRQPKGMSAATVGQIAQRLGEHARKHRPSSISVVFHGGEPLLVGAAALDRVATAIRAAVPTPTTVDFSVQTNGVLLDEAFLDVFRRHDVRVGVSVDGDQAATDRHRVLPSGRGSYASVARGIRLLAEERNRGIYGGLLCTVDLANDPVATYEWLVEQFAPPRLDLLLPHGNWSVPPPGRPPTFDESGYSAWLIAIFDRWYAAAQFETEIRLFDSMILSILGGRSETEALGPRSAIVTVETDGSYERSDALKTTQEGLAATGLNVFEHDFDAAVRATTAPPLSDTCRACPVLSVCGGGLLAHRYRADNGFVNPSVYCADLLRVISHVRSRVLADVCPGTMR